MKPRNGVQVITNRSRAFEKGISPVSVVVPLTTSHAYRSKQQQDWSLRAWAHAQMYIQAGGKVAFVGFSYAPEYLPTFDKLVPDVPELYGVPCFAKEHIDRFRNSLRKYWERKGIKGEYKHRGVVYNEGQLGIDDMICSEYGSDRIYTDNHGRTRQATKRPHYHTLLFLPPELVEKCSTWTDAQWLRHFQKYWPFGAVRGSHDMPLFIDGDGATTYTTKYCCKQFDFYSQPEIRKYLYNSDGSVNKERREAIKDCIPFHHQSNGFGRSLMNVFDTDEKMIDGVDMLLPCDVQKGKTKLKKPPHYILRKKYMEFDGDGNYKYTDDGYYFMIKKYFDRYHKRTKFYQDMIDGVGRYEGMQVQLEDGRCTKIRDYITGILGYCAPTLANELALYEMVFASNSFNPVMDIYQCDLDAQTLPELEWSAFYIYEKRLKMRCLTFNKHHPPRMCEYEENGYFNELLDTDRVRFHYEMNEIVENYVERFDFFPDIIDICRELSFKQSKMTDDKFQQDFRKKKQVKQFLYAQL